MKPAALPAVVLSVSILAFTGCGTGSPSCVTGSSLGLSPATATADSAAKSPGNQQQFVAGSTNISLQGNCPLNQLAFRLFPTWTNPDPLHISISSAQDDTNGLATCKGPTGGPVTLTATPATKTVPATASVQLTCQ